MNLERAKAVQIEIMTRLLDYELLPPSRDGYPRFRPKKAWAKRPPRGSKTPTRKLDPRQVIAAGITPPKRGKDKRTANRNGYGILITCQRKADMNGPIVKRAVQLAGGEARVLYTGLVQAAVTAPTPLNAAPQGGGAVRIGDSIGRTNAAGTLGCFVNLAGSSEIFVLSNNHVLARNNKGKKGADILSPAPADGGTRSKNIIADLHDWHDIDFGADGANTVDCAVAKVRAGVNVDRHNVQFAAASAPEQISGQVATVSSLSEGDRVRKVGRSSRATSGHIMSINQPVTVSAGGSNQAFYSGQIFVENPTKKFAVVGDSGSVVFNDAMDAVGLVFAVNTTAPWVAYCNPMSEVLGAFGATL